MACCALPESVVSLPRGIPAASLKLEWLDRHLPPRARSSAGNTRGLIEAKYQLTMPAPDGGRLPRGIPAASLKQRATSEYIRSVCCLPRGIPAASLKPRATRRTLRSRPGLPRGIPAASLKREDVKGGHNLGLKSSAGNTRGLIEARSSSFRTVRGPTSSAGNTRGLIEARVHRLSVHTDSRSSAGNTRGLIEAMLPQFMP